MICHKLLSISDYFLIVLICYNIILKLLQWNFQYLNDHNMFDIVDDAYPYILNDISNMYQWYFIKFYQFQSIYKLFWYATIKYYNYYNEIFSILFKWS